MLWFVCFFNYADRQAIFAMFPKLKEEFGFDKVQLALIGSAFMWVYAAGAPLAGYICDRFRRKDLILGGCLFWSFVTITTGWCSKLWHFVTVRALEGFGETFYFPASMSLVSDYHDKRTRSRALSFHQSQLHRSPEEHARRQCGCHSFSRTVPNPRLLSVPTQFRDCLEAR